MKRDKIEVNDRQLACAHVDSPEGQDYLKAMAAAANYAWVNRSSMTFLARQVNIPLSVSTGSYFWEKFLQFWFDCSVLTVLDSEVTIIFLSYC